MEIINTAIFRTNFIYNNFFPKILLFFKNVIPDELQLKWYASEILRTLPVFRS